MSGINAKCFESYNIFSEVLEDRPDSAQTHDSINTKENSEKEDNVLYRSSNLKQ